MTGERDDTYIDINRICSDCKVTNARHDDRFDVDKEGSNT